MSDLLLIPAVIEFDWPETWQEWLFYAGGFAVALAVVVWLYLRDTRAMGRGWRVWLTALRLGVVAALAVIAINPHDRTQKTSHLPSRTALLVDTSLSMRYPATAASAESPAGAGQSRAEAVRQLLADSGLVDELRETHEVSLHTFDSQLDQARHVFRARGAGGRRQESGVGNQNETNAPANETTRPPDDQTTTPPDWDKLLEPDGLETRLGEALLELVRQESGKTLSGIVVVSDGGSNAGIEVSTARDVAKESGTKLLTVGVGSTEPPINVKLANVQAPTEAHIGDPYEITAFVQGQGMAGRAVEVELAMKPEDEETEPTPLETQQVVLHEDGVPTEVTFSRSPTVAGGFEYFVRATPVARVRELSEEDNRRRKTVNVRERKTRVLLIAGGPLRDYRFARNLFYRHSAITVDVWLQTVDADSIGMVSQESDKLLLQFPESAAELAEYDAVVAFDPDWRRISEEKRQLLAEWVGEQAGGLILVAGNVYTPQLAEAGENELATVQALYPVFLSSYLLDVQFNREWDQPWPVELTPDGRDAGFLELSEDAAAVDPVWERFQGIYRCYPTAGSKAGATVYAHFSDPRTQTEYGQPVLLASQFYGAGRTLYLGSAEMWRMRALSEDYYNRFWIKAVREMAQGRLKRGSSRGMLLLEKNEYVLGQTVRVRATLYTPQMEKLDVPSVEMDVYNPDGKPLLPPRKLNRDENRPGQYAGDFRAGVPGTWRVEVPIPESNETLVSKVDVVLPNLESDQPEQNAALLTDLAEETGGRYFTVGQAAGELPAHLPDRSDTVIVDERLRTLWDRQWVLFLLVGLLSVEWLTRKLLRLA